MYENPSCVDLEIEADERVEMHDAFNRRVTRTYRSSRKRRSESRYQRLSDLAHVLQQHVRYLPDSFYLAFDEYTMRQLVSGGAVNLAKVEEALESPVGSEIIAWYKSTVAVKGVR